MPEHLVLDCSGGEATHRAMTAAEALALGRVRAAVAAQEAAVNAPPDMAARAQAVATLRQKAGSDPAFAALLRVLGL